mmetsp:Transcript_16018/g.18426  ORF Transcript_16018/g.18426 Transcript_16018/m.18426 type:complete len:884 (+) Transcript_16018:111-2762(+)
MTPFQQYQNKRYTFRRRKLNKCCNNLVPFLFLLYLCCLSRPVLSFSPAYYAPPNHSNQPQKIRNTDPNWICQMTSNLHQESMNDAVVTRRPTTSPSLSGVFYEQNTTAFTFINAINDAVYGSKKIPNQHVHHVEHAESILRHMISQHCLSKLTIQCFTPIINAWCRLNNPERAEIVLMELFLPVVKQFRDGLSGGLLSTNMLPTASVYTPIIDAWARRCQEPTHHNGNTRYAAAERAEALLWRCKSLSEKMELPKLSPRTIEYNAVMNAWSKCGRRRNKRDVGKNSRNGDPYKKAGNKRKSNTGSEIVHAAQRAENILCQLVGGSTGQTSRRNKNSDAVSTQIIAKSNMPIADTISYNTVMDAWARSNDLENAGNRAEGLLEQMRLLEMEGSVHVRRNRISFTSVIGAITQSGEFYAAERAEKKLKEMMELYNKNGNPDLQPDTILFGSVINCWAKSHQKGSAKRAEAILSLQYDFYGRHKHELSRENDVTGTTNLQLQRLRPNTVSINAVLNAWANSSEDEAAIRAESIFEWMLAGYEAGDEFMRPDTVSLTLAIHAWSQSRLVGAADRAYLLLKKMLDGNEVIVRPNTKCFNAVIAAFARRGEAERAESILKLMLISNRENNRNKEQGIYPDTVSFNSVIDGWSKSGKPEAPERAMAIFRHMRDDRNKNVVPDTITLNSVINCIAKSKNNYNTRSGGSNAKKAYALLREIQSPKTGDYDTIRPNIITYTAIVNACAFSSDGENNFGLAKNSDAFKIAVKVMKESNSSPDVACQPDSRFYAAFLKMVANQLEIGDDRDAVARSVFQSCCRHGMVNTFILHNLGLASKSTLIKALDVNSNGDLNAKAIKRISASNINRDDIPLDWSCNVRQWTSTIKARTTAK